jgi:lysophospholipid acyltransferase (LPLAT)-like uncharacterized protein
MSNSEPSPTKPVNEVRGWRRPIVWLASMLYLLWLRTLRIESAKDLAELEALKDQNLILLLWHNRFFTAFEAHRRTRGKHHQLYGMVSASRDGGTLSAFFRKIGIIPVRGSSSRRGSQALREMIGIVKYKGDVGITLDGPRGPIYKAQPGAALLMMKTQAPVVIFEAECSSFWRLKSWDRFILPKPFSKVKIRVKYIKRLPDGSDSLARKKVIETLETQLREFSPDPEN